MFFLSRILARCSSSLLVTNPGPIFQVSETVAATSTQYLTASIVQLRSSYMLAGGLRCLEMRAEKKNALALQSFSLRLSLENFSSSTGNSLHILHAWRPGDWR